jgi:hypothetical protein
MDEYDGKQFVGIDLHRRRSVIVRQSESGEQLSAVRIVNDPDGGQALASGKGHLGGVGEARVWQPASSPTEAPPHRSDTNPTTRESTTTGALSFPKSPLSSQGTK